MAGGGRGGRGGRGLAVVPRTGPGAPALRGHAGRGRTGHGLRARGALAQADRRADGEAQAVLLCAGALLSPLPDLPPLPPRSLECPCARPLLFPPRLPPSPLRGMRPHLEDLPPRESRRALALGGLAAPADARPPPAPPTPASPLPPSRAPRLRPAPGSRARPRPSRRRRRVTRPRWWSTSTTL